MSKYNLIFLTAIISGISIFINKFGVGFSNPYIFTFVKNAAVSVLLFGALFLLKEHKLISKIRKRGWAKLISIGFVGGSIPFLLFFRGLQITTSAKASFLHKTMFIYVAVLAFIFLKERFDWKMAAASIILILGNFLLLNLAWQPFNIGDLMIIGATLLWAAENTLSKHTLKTISPRIVAFSRMFFGSSFILAFLIATGNIADLLVLSGRQIIWSIIPTLFLFGYLIAWYTGLKRVSVTTATAILLLGSPITTLLNAAAGSSISLAQVSGILLVGIGAAVFTISAKKAEFGEVSFA